MTGARTPRAPETFSVLGTPVQALTVEQWTSLVADAVATRQRLLVASQNLHSVYLYHRTPSMRALHGRACVHVDGMPLVVWGRLLGHPLRSEHRVTWVDWLPLLMREAAKHGWRVFHLGGHPGVGERAARKLRERHPGLSLHTQHGHFGDVDGDEALAVVDRINDARPDVLLVGMGMPRQEQWVLAHAHGLRAPVIMICGAAFDYVAGTAPTPPRWMGRLGIEWLHRLAAEPQRMWRRYLVEPFGLVPVALRDLAVFRAAAGRSANAAATPPPPDASRKLRQGSD